MCGRASLFTSSSTIGDRFDVSVPTDLSPSYNVAPEDDVAVIRDETPGRVETCSWGFVPHWADTPADWNGLINARTETADEKPAFRDAFTRSDDERPYSGGHCLVLADGFYEWQERTDGKQPFRVERKDGQPFAMAGLWSRWVGDGGESLVSVAVLTTEPNDLVEPLHHRMAVIFDADEERRWLSDSPQDKAELLVPHPGDGFTKYPISTAVNDPRNDSPELIEPVDVPESDPQTGLDQFG